jgi:hypothetical protein
MANWIKVEKSTHTKPEILRLARLLGVSKNEAFALVVRFWAWADEVTVDGRVDAVVSTDVDNLVDHAGFAEALEQVGWLNFNDERELLEIPNFERHNGASAKKRAEKAERQRKWRENKDAPVDATVDTPVDASETQARTPEEIRGDKIREEDKKVAPASPSRVDYEQLVNDYDLPEHLDTDSVRESMVEWLENKRSKRQGYKQPERYFLKKVCEYFKTPDALIAAIDAAIVNGWQGCIQASTPTGGENNGRKPNQVRTQAIEVVHRPGDEPQLIR